MPPPKRALLIALAPLVLLAGCREGLLTDPANAPPERSLKPPTTSAQISSEPSVQAITPQMERQLAAFREAASARKKVLAASVAPALAPGAVITVPTDFPTIQDAVNAAAAGSTILVKAGTYVVPGGVFVGTSGLTITAETGTTVVGGFTIIADDVRLEKFDIVADGFYGVGLIGQRVVVSQNRISAPAGVTCGGNTCIFGILTNFDVNTSIDRNTVTGPGFGILTYQSSGATIDRNTISGTTIAGAVQLENSSNQTVTNNVMTANTDAIVLFFTTSSTIANNRSTGTSFNGIFTGSSNQNEISRNTLSGTRFNTIFLSTSNNTRVSNNTVTGALVGNPIQLLSSNSSEVSYNSVTLPDPGNFRPGIDVVRSTNDLIAHNFVAVNGANIRLFFSSDDRVENNTTSGGQFGIASSGSNARNIIARNQVTGAEFVGIDVFNATEHEVLNNKVTLGSDGIRFVLGGMHRVAFNEARDNQFVGLIFQSTSNNTVERNKAFNNLVCDITENDGTNNTFSKNSAGCVSLGNP